MSGDNQVAVNPAELDIIAGQWHMLVRNFDGHSPPHVIVNQGWPSGMGLPGVYGAVAGAHVALQAQMAGNAANLQASSGAYRNQEGNSATGLTT